MKATIIVLLLTGLYACGSNPAAPVPEQLNTNRLQALIYHDSLLSASDVAGIIGEPAPELKVHAAAIIADSSQHSKLFSWPDGRTRKITNSGKKQITLQAYSSLGVGFFRRTDKSSFQEEYESKETIKKRIDAMVKDKDTDPDIAIAEVKYLASQSAVQQFEQIEQVGEMAYWETPVQALHVFAKGYAFTITTNMESSAESLERAIALARLIFTTCSTH